MTTPRPNAEYDASALEACAILDTPPESEYEDLTYLASVICGTPIALVSLLDKDRQWFKSAKGLEIRETPIQISFCAHAVQTPEEVMMIPDATLDPRFSGSPLVTSDPHIRLYAGAPILLGDGAVVGTVCVIDREARVLNEHQIEGLKRLANQASRILDFRRTVFRLMETRNDFLTIATNFSRTEEKYKAFLEKHPIAIIQYDSETNEIVEVNAATVELYGYSRGELFSMGISDLMCDIPAETVPFNKANVSKHLRKDGSVLSVYLQSTQLESEGRNLRTVSIVNAGRQSEITKALMVVQEDFANAFESAPVGMALVSSSDQIFMVNDSFVRLLGREREEMEESLLASYIDPDDDEKLREKLATLVFGGVKSIQHEVRMKRKDETWVRVLFSGTLVRDEKGSPLHLVVQLLEIFERAAG